MTPLWEKQWPDGAFDYWITTGGKQYQNTGFWTLSPQRSNEKVNHFIAVDKFLEILRNAEPASVGVYHYHNDSYLLIEYNLTSVGKTWGLAKEVKAPSWPFHLWIDPDTGSLVKGELTVIGQYKDGSQAHFEIQQAFTSYNEDIIITAPTVGASLRKPAKTARRRVFISLSFILFFIAICCFVGAIGEADPSSYFIAGAILVVLGAIPLLLLRRGGRK